MRNATCISNPRRERRPQAIAWTVRLSALAAAALAMLALVSPVSGPAAAEEPGPPSRAAPRAAAAPTPVAEEGPPAGPSGEESPGPPEAPEERLPAAVPGTETPAQPPAEVPPAEAVPAVTPPAAVPSLTPPTAVPLTTQSQGPAPLSPREVALRAAIRMFTEAAGLVWVPEEVLGQGPLAAKPPRKPLQGPILLNFQDASLRAVLEYLSEAAGLIVVAEAPVDGRVTVMSRQPLSVDEAVALLDTVLKEKGYAAVRSGRTLKVVTLDQAKKAAIPVGSGNDPAALEPSDRLVTHIIPVQFADAVQLKRDLAALIPTYADLTANQSTNTLILTDTQTNVRRILEIIRALDSHMASVSEVKVFQLKYANAASAARLITEMFGGDESAQAGRGGVSGGRRGFMFPGMPGMPGGPGGPGGSQQTDSEQRGARQQKVTASADDRTNTLVVSAPHDLLAVIEGVVKELDSNPTEEQSVFIYPLKNAIAVNIEGVLNNLFGSSGTSGTRTGTSRGGAGTTTRTQGTTGSRATGGRASGGSSGFGTLGTGSTGGFGSSARSTTSGRTTGRTTGGSFGQGGTARLSSSAAATASELVGQVYVVADADTNSLLVTAASKHFERIKEILAELDRPVPQVLIKVLIAEVTREKTSDLGVEFSILNLRTNGNGSTFGTDFAVAAQQGGLQINVLEVDVTAALRALEGLGTLDVLSRPYILTSDNQEASITVGQEVPFIRNTRTTETGQTINTIEYDDIGILLTVTPHINPEGLVIMDVYPEISALTGTTVPISEAVNAPVFAKRAASSRVAIRDGQTIVIGGLMEDRNTDTIQKVPILGDIPGLGLLFQRTIHDKVKTELLIFLTPHVARVPDDLKAMSADEQAGAKVIREAVEPGAFDEHLKGMERGAASRRGETPESGSAPLDVRKEPPPAGAPDEPQR